MTKHALLASFPAHISINVMCKYTVKLQSVTKVMEKTNIWTILCFSPLPLLNYIREQWVKLVSRNFMRSQHCIGGERIF